MQKFLIYKPCGNTMNKSFQGVYVNSQQISYLLESWFSSKGYKAQVLGNENSFVVQAKKEGFFRTFTGADSAFTQTSSPPSEGSP
jgi:hypothetical protein